MSEESARAYIDQASQLLRDRGPELGAGDLAVTYAALAQAEATLALIQQVRTTANGNAVRGLVSVFDAFNTSSAQKLTDALRDLIRKLGNG